MQAVFGKMQRWLQGNFQDGADFIAKLESGPPALIKLDAGKAIRPYVEEIVLRLGKNPGVIQRIDIKEYERSLTSIEFKDLIINAPVNSEIFESP